MKNIEVGSMVRISDLAPGNVQGQYGWISRLGKDEKGEWAIVALRDGIFNIDLHLEYLEDAREGYELPTIESATLLDPYDQNRPKAEAYLSDLIKLAIENARSNNYWYVNRLFMWLDNIDDTAALVGFYAISPVVEKLIGREACNLVGELVCDAMGFTIDEAYELHMKAK